MTTINLALAATTAAALLLAATAPAMAQSPREQAAANFSAADANGDNALSMQEFPNFIDLNAQHNIGRASMIASTGRYSMAFGRADGNGDGFVTLPEIAQISGQN